MRATGARGGKSISIRSAEVAGGGSPGRSSGRVRSAAERRWRVVARPLVVVVTTWDHATCAGARGPGESADRPSEGPCRSVEYRLPCPPPNRNAHERVMTPMLHRLIGRNTAVSMLKEGLDASSLRARQIAHRVANASTPNGGGFAGVLERAQVIGPD